MALQETMRGNKIFESFFFKFVCSSRETSLIFNRLLSFLQAEVLSINALQAEVLSINAPIAISSALSI